MKNLICLLAATFMMVAVADSAFALAPFKKAFQKKYIDDHENEDFQKAAKKASCNLCHVKKAKKNFNNAYGKLLKELIEGDAEHRLKDAKEEGGNDAKKEELVKIMEELDKAFEKVAEMHSVKDDEESPTFGELIKAGEIPISEERALEDHKIELEEIEKRKGEGDVEVKAADSDK